MKKSVVSTHLKVGAAKAVATKKPERLSWEQFLHMLVSKRLASLSEINDKGFQKAIRAEILKLNIIKRGTSKAALDFVVESYRGYESKKPRTANAQEIMASLFETRPIRSKVNSVFNLASTLRVAVPQKVLASAAVKLNLANEPYFFRTVVRVSEFLCAYFVDENGKDHNVKKLKAQIDNMKYDRTAKILVPPEISRKIKQCAKECGATEDQL